MQSPLNGLSRIQHRGWNKNKEEFFNPGTESFGNASRMRSPPRGVRDGFDDSYGELQQTIPEYSITGESYFTNRRYDDNRMHKAKSHFRNNVDEDSRTSRWWRVQYYSHLLELYKIFMTEIERYNLETEDYNFEDFCTFVLRSSSGEISDYL